MKKKTGEEVLRKMISLLLIYVAELFPYKDVDGEQFQYGERLAYTECLEMLQEWEGATECGLDFDIEGKYPL